MTLTQFPKNFFENYEDILGKMVWIFCPEMTLAQFPEFGFFVQNSRIGVNLHKLELRVKLELSTILDFGGF